jgi:predicted aldo/keto reductase-like oxidoreductase
MEDLSLTPDEKKDLQLGSRMGLQGLYCQQCRSCISQCHAPIDIPTLMRSYMYVYGYGNLAKAKEALRSIDLPTGTCDACSECAVTCSMGFDVKRKIQDIARIKNVPDDFIV